MNRLTIYSLFSKFHVLITLFLINYLWFANSFVDNLYLTYVTAHHSFIHALIHPSVRSFTHSLAHSLTHSVIHLFSHSLTYPLVHSLIHSFVRSFVHSLIYWLIHTFIYLTISGLINCRLINYISSHPLTFCIFFGPLLMSDNTQGIHQYVLFIISQLSVILVVYLY